MLASPLLEGWPLSSKFNEAETSSRDTTARAFAVSGFDRQDCSRQPQSWLHDCRPFIMMNTLQFTRTTELSWRTRRQRRERSLDEARHEIHGSGVPASCPGISTKLF